jgi:hypothetical protein
MHQASGLFLTLFDRFRFGLQLTAWPVYVLAILRARKAAPHIASSDLTVELVRHLFALSNDNAEGLLAFPHRAQVPFAPDCVTEWQKRGLPGSFATILRTQIGATASSCETGFRFAHGCSQKTG